MRVRVSIRTRDYYEMFRNVMRRYLGRDDFRICHISIQHSHFHLLVEAADARALSRGMQSFGIAFARRYHGERGSCGKVFEHRYFATQVTTSRYARHALAYVLNNWRRHRVDYEHGVESPWKLDPFSSAIAFEGWTERFVRPKAYNPLPVSPPRTALLRSGWQEFGRLSPYETPGPLR